MEPEVQAVVFGPVLRRTNTSWPFDGLVTGRPTVIPFMPSSPTSLPLVETFRFLAVCVYTVQSWTALIQERPGDASRDSF